jgi:hypothetical protein
MEYRGCGMRAETEKNRLAGHAKQTTSVEKFSSHCIKFIILRLSYDLKPHFIPLLTRTREPRAQTHLLCAFYANAQAPSRVIASFNQSVSLQEQLHFVKLISWTKTIFNKYILL